MDDRSIIDALAAAAATDHAVRVVEHDGRTVELPYRALFAEALTIGGALDAAGLSRGDRVALVLPDVNEFVRAFFGICAAGLVPVPMCPPAQAGDVATFARQSRHVLSAARAAAIVTSLDVAPLLDFTGVAPLAVFTVDTIAKGPALDAPARVSMDDVALVQFTSGSTASPKGVVLTHRNIESNVLAISGPDGLHTQPGDVAVSWLPLYHDMGLIGMLIGAVYAQVPLVLMSPVLFLKRPSSWLDAISRYKATISFAPNFAYDLCRRRVKPSQVAALDLSSWRVAGCGAEPIRSGSLHAFADHFAAAGFRASSFLPSYGLAEHVLAVTFSRHGLHLDAVDAERLVRESRAVPASSSGPAVHLVGCGRAFPDHAIRIVDDNFRDLPDRHVGSIIVRGPSVMRGYFEDPAATHAVLHQGWLLTGDVGYMAGGELFVCGRIKDLIIRQGKKYHPPDLESAIADVRPISGVVVFGINHLEAADEVVAVLEARASGRPTTLEDDVRRRVRETAGLEIDQIIVTPPGTIPRTTSGKVRRAETRARFQAGTLLRSDPFGVGRAPTLVE